MVSFIPGILERRNAGVARQNPSYSILSSMCGGLSSVPGYYESSPCATPQYYQYGFRQASSIH